MDDNKVAVLLEDLMSQFRTFGEGLDGLRDEMKEFRKETNNGLNNLEQELINFKAENRLEHKQIIQAGQDLDNEVKKAGHRSSPNKTGKIMRIYNQLTLQKSNT